MLVATQNYAGTRLKNFITDNFQPTAQMAHGLVPPLALDESALAAKFRVGNVYRLRVERAGGIVGRILHHLDLPASFCLSFFSLTETT